MKNIMKGLTVLLVTIFMMCSQSIYSAYAGEINAMFTVKFVVVDSSNSYDGTSFTVNMKDVMGVFSQDYEIKKAASWGNTTGNIPAISVPSPNTYKISIVGINDGYKLRDFMSGKDIDSSFVATNNGEMTFYWEIVKDEVGSSTTQEAAVSINEATDIMAGNVITDEQDADNQDAEKVYQEFLDTVSFIEGDSSWESMLQGYSFPSLLSTFGKMYANCVSSDGKSEEEMISEYEAMSDYDKFLWVSTYLFMADSIKNGHPDNVSSFEKIITNSACPVQNMQIGKRTKSEEVIEAYKKLIQWQADYIAANGSPFNFINNRSYLEEMGVKKVEAPATEGAEIQEQKEIEEVREEIMKEVKKEDKGIWSDTLDILSKNLITIAVLMTLLLGLGYVIYLKKKNNYTEAIHEK